MTNIGIIGATGYTGEVLVQLIARHPNVHLQAVFSRSLAGKKVASSIPSLRGTLRDDFKFEASDANAIAERQDIDLYFLALPHGIATTFAEPLVHAGKQVIDLSADYRVQSPAAYQRYYNQPHPNTELLKQARYIIPELAIEPWQKTPLLASPGCYPTSILIPLIPLVRDSLIDLGHIVINAYSGISGAGKKLDESFLFCECNENTQAYAIPQHRHLSEIEEQLSFAAARDVIVQFNPHLAPMRRGIATTITVPASSDIDAVYTAWAKQYATSPCVHILSPDKRPNTSAVVGSNRIDISAAHDPRTNNFVITSALDNLMKGASGQAIQIMNLSLGLKETTGLFT